MNTLATMLLNWAQVSFCIAALVFAVISAQMASEKTAARRERRRKAKCRDAGERLAHLSDAQIERLYRDITRPKVRRPSSLDSSLHCEANDPREAATELLSRIGAR